MPPTWLQISRVRLVRTAQAMAAIHVFVELVAEITPCTGYSMLPTLSHDGDCVLASPLPYWRPAWLGGWPNSRPGRGEVVVATNPLNPSYTVCKRVLGVEGDVVEVEPRRSNITWSADSDTTRPMEGHFVRIPKGHVWLAGDNLSNSTDSRTYGPVPLAMVRGKVIARFESIYLLPHSEEIANPRYGATDGSLGNDWTHHHENLDYPLLHRYRLQHGLDQDLSDMLTLYTTTDLIICIVNPA